MKMNRITAWSNATFIVLATFVIRSAIAQQNVEPLDAEWVREHYTKKEHMVPMRDGVRLHTVIYSPKDESIAYPIMMLRTPYSCRPYGEDGVRSSLGPSDVFARDGFIFVYQDVRGAWMSEGEFVNMRPHIDVKTGDQDVDESTDCYDTVAWLLEHIPNNNGRVGMWGISYPGFYAAASMIDAHPALVAVSPQAPIADWWYDDFHHHGAFFLPHGFRFLSSFGHARPAPTTERPERGFEFWTPDGYQFYLDMGPLKNANEKYLHGKIAFWNEIVAHPNYDEFWQSRNILPHLHHTAAASMIVGGWFDAEDLYGPLQIYREVERANIGVENTIVMGPWRHGGWARGSGESLGHVHFGSATSEFYQNEIEFPFFLHHLKGGPEPNLPEAFMFNTGVNEWRRFDVWPPEAEERFLHVGARESLSFNPPRETASAFDEYISDPAKPVPFTEDVAQGMTREYMTDDQRFAARRPDVLVYQTEALEEDITLAGPIIAELWVSTSGTDSDWIVKVIDVFPPDAEDTEATGERMHMGNYHMMVRSEVIRGRFRNSHEHPEPFTPNEPTYVELPLQDVLHTFRKGHCIQIQIQSTWFPLVDRNPQTFVPNIYLANESDFVKATQRVHRSAEHPSRLRVGLLR